MIESIDRSLAKTIAALKKAGKLDNTIPGRCPGL